MHEIKKMSIERIWGVGRTQKRPRNSKPRETAGALPLPNSLANMCVNIPRHRAQKKPLTFRKWQSGHGGFEAPRRSTPQNGGNVKLTYERFSDMKRIGGRIMNANERITNLLGLARTANAANNQAEAEKYFTQVLEQDPKISEAWLGKGKAVAWQSSLDNIRLHEALVLFKNAIAMAPDTDKQEVAELAIKEINEAAVTIYTMAEKHVKEFVTLPDAWNTYSSRLLQLIAALEEISDWTPNNKILLENIIHFSKVLIEGMQFDDPLDNNSHKVWQLTPDYENMLREKINITANKIKSIDPNYVPPNPQVKQPKEGCFVVTATMGNENDDIVICLRNFRDKILKRTTLGNVFISWYYKNGPYFAEKIRKSKTLRSLSYCFIVLPAFCIAKLLMDINNR